MILCDAMIRVNWHGLACLSICLTGDAVYGQFVEFSAHKAHVPMAHFIPFIHTRPPLNPMRHISRVTCIGQMGWTGLSFM